MAGAMGLPYAVTGSFAGTDLADDNGNGYFQVADPVGGRERIGLVKVLRPDLTLIHRVCADEDGNVVLAAPSGEGHWAAYAARHGVLASVERIVSREELREIDAGQAAAWYREWVVEVGSHQGYLAKLGDTRRGALAWPSWAPLPGPLVGAETPAGKQERLIVLGARAVVDRVRTGGYDTLLAGIGSSHIAAWLAAAALRRTGHDVQVVAELGCYGLEPRHGDVYLFSLAHAEAAAGLSSVAEILGGMVAGRRRAGTSTVREVVSQFGRFRRDPPGAEGKGSFNVHNGRPALGRIRAALRRARPLLPAYPRRARRRGGGGRPYWGVAADRFTRRVRPGTRGRLVFGDAAGAGVRAKGVEAPGLYDSVLNSDATEAETVVARPPEGWLRPRPELIDLAVRSSLSVADRLLPGNQMKISDVQWLVPHPGNNAIHRGVRDGLGLPPKKFLTNFHTRGNTGCASIPIALSEFRDAGRVNRGDLILSTAVGSGWYYGGLLFRL